MQWSEDLPEEWDDAPNDPPQTTPTDEVEMTWTEDGFILTPTAAQGKTAIKATSLFTTIACEVGANAADVEREVDYGEYGEAPSPSDVNEQDEREPAEPQ